MLTYLMTLLGAFMAPKVLTTLATILGLILADTVLGILLSLKQGKFAWSKLGQFMASNLFPYAGGLLVLALFSSSNTALATLFFTIAATTSVKFLADIGTKASQLFSGISFQSPIEVVPKPTPAPASQSDKFEPPISQ